MSQSIFQFSQCLHISIVQNNTYEVRAGSKAAARKLLNKGKPSSRVIRTSRNIDKPIIATVSCNFLGESAAELDAEELPDIFEEESL